MPTASLRARPWWPYASWILRKWWAFLVAYGAAVVSNLFALIFSEGWAGLLRYHDLAQALDLGWYLALIAINPLLALIIVLVVNDAATLFAIWGRREDNLVKRQEAAIENREREEAMAAAQQVLVERVLRELDERGIIQ